MSNGKLLAIVHCEGDHICSVVLVRAICFLDHYVPIVVMGVNVKWFCSKVSAVDGLRGAINRVVDWGVCVKAPWGPTEEN